MKISAINPTSFQIIHRTYNKFTKVSTKPANLPFDPSNNAAVHVTISPAAKALKVSEIGGK